MKSLRTFSTPRLLLLAALLALVAGGGAAIAVAARGGGGPTPPPKALPQAIHDALAAPAPTGVTARISFTNRLFPSGALLGNVGSALMSGASGRLWLGDQGGRLELQSNAGDVQVVWDESKVSVYDASSNTVYRVTLPAAKPDAAAKDPGTPPSLSEIQDFLTQLATQASVSGARPDDVAGHAAYTVEVAPKHDGGLLGSAQLAWDAAHGVPLRAAIYAQGSSRPVLELTAKQISFGPVSAAETNVSPPAGAKTVDLSPPSGHDAAGAKEAPVTGLAAVNAAAGFPVVAPDALVGLPRQDVRLVGSGDSKAVLVVYGQGLGALAVLERPADPAAAQRNGPLASLPRVSLDGVTGHELATQLGTVLEWQRSGVDFVVAGSLPPAAAEAAARNLG